jgi:hypothetical protein
MKMRILVILGLLMGFASISSAFPNEDAQKVVESFYAQYYKEYLRQPARSETAKARLKNRTTVKRWSLPQ